ncbi:endodeoxyribonuclease [Exophiala xenobiotica]|nr:endodeoxyribonuclease [Exophiala xenobiotica]KAK5211330.1 endodeoxyribonuclease [Exophiala xenobiotica]KAK5218663.1 endodeoxyribonuclease [Exophiala xenobiotica]KAK5220872.1 endodeoxyribonuclease [Exophiala xenobiotica]KAK5290360.1 endodeoxyribonuclease [Exophiala xenobiotica]
MDLDRPDNDTTLQTCTPQITVASQKVLDFIENTFNNILREIEVRPCGKPVIVLRRIVAVRPYYDEADFMRLKWHIEDREVQYRFPGKTDDEAWRFSERQRARDIYYHDPTLFKQQETVDRYIDDIAHTCQVARSDLKVTGSPKGLHAGLFNNDRTDQTATIPAVDIGFTFPDLSHLRWVLVIEKEATFNSLVERRYQQKATIGPGLLVTAKGYPDLGTRRFLRALLNRAEPSIKVFGLMDWDPDGIQILKCYRYGSKKMAQEYGCNIPEMKWIGLKAEDVTRKGQADNASMPLSMRDRAIALSMLTSGEWRDGSGTLLPGLEECTAELQLMLMLNRKAEIQILDESGNGLEEWLTVRLADELQEDRIMW